MTHTRRNFFKLAAGAAALTAVPMPSLSSAPMLWGDGVHDDAPGLNALMRGDVVEFSNPAMAKGAGWSGKHLTLPKGTYRTKSIVDFGKLDGVVVSCSGSTIIVDHSEKYAIRMEVFRESVVTDIAVKTNSRNEYAIWVKHAPGGLGSKPLSGWTTVPPLRVAPTTY